MCFGIDVPTSPPTVRGYHELHASFNRPQDKIGAAMTTLRQFVTDPPMQAISVTRRYDIISSPSSALGSTLAVWIWMKT